MDKKNNRQGKSEKGKTSRVKRIIYDFLLILCLGVVVYCGVKLYLIHKDYSDAQNEFDQLQETTKRPDPEEEKDPEWYELNVVDFNTLKDINEDVAGWIYFENNDLIDFPVMYSGDDVYYLRKTIRKEYSIPGTPFIEGSNTPNFQDAHTLIYGHNLRNGNMFSSLTKYKDEDGYFQDHQYFQIATEDYTYRYQIFAWNDTDKNNDVYTVYFDQDDRYQAFLDTMLQEAFYNTGVPVSKEDKVITLSTCSDSSDRFVVHAKRVAAYDIANDKVLDETEANQLK